MPIQLMCPVCKKSVDGPAFVDKLGEVYHKDCVGLSAENRVDKRREIANRYPELADGCLEFLAESDLDKILNSPWVVIWAQGIDGCQRPEDLIKNLNELREEDDLAIHLSEPDDRKERWLDQNLRAIYSGGVKVKASCTMKPIWTLSYGENQSSREFEILPDGGVSEIPDGWNGAS